MLPWICISKGVKWLICSRWGRITILTTLSEYQTSDVKEAEHICERVVPQFQHVNPSVVLAAVKVVFLHMRTISAELARQYLRKMAPPLGGVSWPYRLKFIQRLMFGSDPRFVCPRSPVRCSAEYRPSAAKATRHTF